MFDNKSKWHSISSILSSLEDVELQLNGGENNAYWYLKCKTLYENYIISFVSS